MTIYTDLEKMLADGIMEEKPEPNCVTIMQWEFVEYVVGKSVTCAFPVLALYSNPRKSMQGGFIGAAFDNTFGTLVYLTTKKMNMVTIDLNITYHKPIYENDRLIVTVYIKSLGKTIIHLVGEAFDSQGNLIASATTNLTLLDNNGK
ncbi:MAG: PaaI family thioesterase [Syntrophomonadaceae bacterium]|nr:PaaI family thioesterase [Syntrophomonadaceae bacterium]